VNPLNIEQLSSEWMEAKEQERMAVERRRVLEDHLALVMELAPDLDTTVTRKDGAYVIKAVGRLNRKVDSEKLQELAAEAGLTDHLSSLFRWKPEIEMKAWKACDPAITGALADAITVSPGRPSFTITTKE
jgi:hypothetical protein